MFCWLKALSLTLVLAALGCMTASCGSGGQAQIRLIYAVPDGQQVDIYVNGTRIARSLEFPDVYPSPSASAASYITVASGNDTIQGYPPGDTVNPIAPSGAMLLNAGNEYTVVAVGLESNDSPPVVIADDNTAPPSNMVEVRIINASLSTELLNPSTGVDVYILPTTVTDLTTYTPQINGLGYGQSSIYQKLDIPSIPNTPGSGYQVIVTASGGKMALLTYAPTTPSPWPAAGSITTLVLLDNPGGITGMSTTPLVLNDLN